MEIYNNVFISKKLITHKTTCLVSDKLKRQLIESESVGEFVEVKNKWRQTNGKFKRIFIEWS